MGMFCGREQTSGHTRSGWDGIDFYHLSLNPNPIPANPVLHWGSQIYPKLHSSPQLCCFGYRRRPVHLPVPTQFSIELKEFQGLGAQGSVPSIASYSPIISRIHDENEAEYGHLDLHNFYRLQSSPLLVPKVGLPCCGILFSISA